MLINFRCFGFMVQSYGENVVHDKKIVVKMMSL